MEPLSAVDAAWFGMEQGENPVDIVGVFVFASEVDRQRLRELVERRLLRSRRFRQRVERRRFGRPRWVEDERFSVDAHLHYDALPGDGSREALEAEVSRITSAPMDTSRPLWDLYVFEGFEGGRSVLVCRLHHALGDGYALMSLVLTMADEAPEPARGKTSGEPTRDRAAPRSLLRAWKRRRELPHAANASARSLAHLVLLPHDPESELHGPLSGERLCAWSDAIALERVKGIGRGLGATVNDIMVAALAGALRRYLSARGENVDALALRALVPVNLRPLGEPVDWDRLGNRFGLVYLELPVHLADPMQRLIALRRAMERLKRSPEALVSHALLFALGLFPRRAARLVEKFFAEKGSVVATNVPGPRAPLSLAGQRVDEFVFFVPHPGPLAVGASIFSYAGVVRVGVRADAAVVRDPRALARAFEDELAALESGLPRSRGL